MKKTCLSVVLILTMLVFFGSLLGCGQASREVSQVKLGMTKAEAVAILGKPQERQTTAQGELLSWRFEGQKVLLVLNQDKVTGKQVTGRKVR
ncbi:MAG: outer membrane protein assembly factor BamE [Syntrophobacterales bacterium]|jgi:hypothetical protein|nr:outer membrane protein assembly factor BamE [Syntrophobacterales bacterium]